MTTRQLVLTLSQADFLDLVTLADSYGETAEDRAADMINGALFQRHHDFSRLNGMQDAIDMRKEILARRSTINKTL